MATSHSTPHGEPRAIPAYIATHPRDLYANCRELRRWLDNEGEAAPEVVRSAAWDVLSTYRNEIADAAPDSIEAILAKVQSLWELFEEEATPGVTAGRGFASVVEGLKRIIEQGRTAQ